MIRFEFVAEEHRRHSVLARMPERSTENAAGYDFFAAADDIIGPGEIKTVWTDLKAKMNRHNVLLLLPRSSMGKRRVVLANGTGVIDSDYYGNSGNDGNIGIMLYNYGDEPYTIKAGDKIAQGIFVCFEKTDDDKAEGERVGGFGSTGN